MSFQPYTIAFSDKGLIKNKKAFLLMDNAFQELFNAYVWRECTKKREGIKLVGRLRRCYTMDVTLDTQADGASYNNSDILDDPSFDLRTTEPNAQIEEGSVQITVGAIVFTDVNSDGVLTDGGTNTGNINYSTGELNLSFSPALGGLTNVDVQMCYFPSLPAMGILQRELAAINVEQTLFFDTKYVYTYNNNDFSSPTTTTWAGSDSDFFWGANYRGSDANQRLFFVTNGASPTLDPLNIIRYTSDASTWTPFTPAVAGTTITNENKGTALSGVAMFMATITNTPVIPGSVIITVDNNPQIRYTDQLTTYPAGNLIGAPNTNTGTIDYSTGDFTLNFDPVLTQDSTITVSYQYSTTSMFQARILIPYYGRLVALNTWEGADAGSSDNFFNRCRFSQIGNPIQTDAWISTIFGKGGFIDAPTNEAIVTARFYKNTLIVLFERSTWILRYQGEYGLPFVWERISSDFGSESTFSSLLFDNGVLAVGDKAIVSSSANDVQRIDLDVPDTVFNFHNQENGKERVHGIRDFQKEIVFWCYSDGALGNKFPNRTLLFNYRNQTWAIFRDNVTCFGTLASPGGDSWDLPIPWDSVVSWDTFYQGELPIIISGNQQGFIHFYQFPVDLESSVDNYINFNEQESLFVQDITRSAGNPLRLTIPNHNLEDLEIIYVANLSFVDTATNTALTTTLNNKFYQVQSIVSDDEIDVYEYDFNVEDYVTTSHDQIGYTPAPGTGTYLGGGVVALLQKPIITTKDFNPIQNEQVKSSYVDFQTDATPNAEISVTVYVDANLNPEDTANLAIYNPDVNTSYGQSGYITNITQDASGGTVTSSEHGLQSGAEITFGNISGMTELNGLTATITFLTADTFRIDIDTSGFTAYTFGGQWWSMDENFFNINGSSYMWHRFYSNVHGQYITYNLSYSDYLMNKPTTHLTDFQLNAITFWFRKAGRMIK